MSLLRGILIGACMLLLLAKSDTPLLQAQTQLALTQTSRVTLQGTWFVRGASDREIAEALALCLAHTALSVCSAIDWSLEGPARRVWVDTFQLDRFEVSNRQYRNCVSENRCSPQNVSERAPHIAKPNHPATGVNWTQAMAYCKQAGGNLPTEAQWERAARGKSKRRFPWGQQYNDRLANHSSRNEGIEVDGYPFAAPVGSFHDGVTNTGVHDLAGNVWEWTRDGFDASFYAKGPVRNPLASPTNSNRSVRGGSWSSNAEALRTTFRVPLHRDAARKDLGFRCAYAKTPKTPKK